MFGAMFRNLNAFPSLLPFFIVVVHVFLDICLGKVCRFETIMCQVWHFSRDQSQSQSGGAERCFSSTLSIRLESPNVSCHPSIKTLWQNPKFLWASILMAHRRERREEMSLEKHSKTELNGEDLAWTGYKTYAVFQGWDEASRMANIISTTSVRFVALERSNVWEYLLVFTLRSPSHELFLFPFKKMICLCSHFDYVLHEHLPSSPSHCFLYSDLDSKLQSLYNLQSPGPSHHIISVLHYCFSSLVDLGPLGAVERGIYLTTIMSGSEARSSWA